MASSHQKPELLCPAGSPAALEAAIQGGADAVYMGGAAFNARINAKNFTPDELRRGIALAHTYGVKIYLAANTLIYDREIDDFLRAAEDAYLSGADGLILADIGCAEQIRRRIPIALHASTQLSGHNTDAARLLANAGFSRMVCAREMSETDLRSFTASSPIEAEVFVHGALCVCHSGQCLFSSVVGGRSGNRGECAQPCRLPFTLANGSKGYPLSLKDLSLAQHIPALCDMGVASFKIEGRMKSPEYVRDVALVFRRLIDEHRGASPEEMQILSSIFSRGGLTDGYYRKQIDKTMFGIRREEDKEKSRTLVPFDRLTKKIPLCLDAVIHAGQSAVLSVASVDRAISVTVRGDVPQDAKTAPLTEEIVRKQLTKLGTTPFEAHSFTLSLDDGLMLPVSALNGLRRQAVEAWEKAQCHHSGRPRIQSDLRDILRLHPHGKRTPQRTALFYHPDRIPTEALSFFDIVYVPVEQYNGTGNGVALPPVIPDSERESVRLALQRAASLGAHHVLVGNLGHLALAQESGMTLHGDFRLNLCNEASVAVAESLGFTDMLLSPELSLPQIRDIGGKVGAIVYGRLPLMITEACLCKATSGCERCARGKAELVDRRGVHFPVLRLPPHRNLILNSVPIYMADRKDELRRANLSMQHFLFTTEQKQEILQVMDAYTHHVPPLSKEGVRRIRS